MWSHHTIAAATGSPHPHAWQVAVPDDSLSDRDGALPDPNLAPVAFATRPDSGAAVSRSNGGSPHAHREVQARDRGDDPGRRTARRQDRGTLLRSVLLDRGVPASDIQYEVFGPDLWQADAD
jgi:hypothetical protein